MGFMSKVSASFEKLKQYLSFIPYKPLLVGPALAYGCGILMNAIVVAANQGQMPVLWPGGCSQFTSDEFVQIHSCMTSASHLKFLADWFLLNGVGEFSPGDFLIWLGAFTWDYALLIWAILMVRDQK